MMSALWVGVATLVTARTRPDGSYRRAIRDALKLHLVLCLAAAALVTMTPVGLATARSLAPGASGIDRSDVQRFFGFMVPDWVLWVMLGIVGTLVAASAAFLGWALWENREAFRRDRGRRRREARYGHGAEVAAETGRVHEALGRARRALASGDDARQAIIAAYAAMEEALVSQGLLRRTAQTPTEVIQEAMAAGILTSTESAGRLLEVFHTARFSTVHLDEGAVATADSALAELQQDLLQRTGGR
jgi:hypothetical protein